MPRNETVENQAQRLPLIGVVFWGFSKDQSKIAYHRREFIKIEESATHHLRVNPYHFWNHRNNCFLLNPSFAMYANKLLQSQSSMCSVQLTITSIFSFERPIWYCGCSSENQESFRLFLSIDITRFSQTSIFHHLLFYESFPLDNLLLIAKGVSSSA